MLMLFSAISNFYQEYRSFFLIIENDSCLVDSYVHVEF